MSDINGKGFGSSHNWRDIGGQRGISHYKCEDCKQNFTHYYDETPNIFKAIEESGVKNLCEGLKNDTQKDC